MQPPPVDGMAAYAGGRFFLGSKPAEIESRWAACEEIVGKVFNGCRHEWFADETYHEVFVEPFYLDLHEVTVGEYLRFAQATGRRGPPTVDDLGTQSSDLPVAMVNIPDAQAYCRWAGKRLPTFAEWQFAARGVERRRFVWGDASPDGSRANYCDRRCGESWRDMEYDDGYAGPAPVGSYPAGRTPEGVWDLAGNVREWTASTDENKRYYVPGGSFQNARDDLWAADVRVLPPLTRFAMLGFRCAKESTP